MAENGILSIKFGVSKQLKDKKILIIGFGMIGSRHAQSLLDSGYKNISIIDENHKNIEKGLDVIGYSKSDVKVIKSTDDIKNHIHDIAIIATSASPRFEIYKNLLSANIKKFLLEKVVFQSDSQFKIALGLEKKAGAIAFCNFPNRYFDNYINLKRQISKIKDHIVMSVNAGDCGMGCSGIHYLDLFEYLTNSSINYSESILKEWTKDNKRGKYYTDFSGLFFASNDKNHTLKINFDKSHEGPCNVDISFKDNQVILYEGQELEYRVVESKKLVNNFSIIPQSKLTSKILNDIFLNKCLMPTINQVSNSHSHLFKECNKAIKSHSNGEICPIT